MIDKKRNKPAISFHKPWLGGDGEGELIDTLRSGWLTVGPKAKNKVITRGFPQ